MYIQICILQYLFKNQHDFEITSLKRKPEELF